MEIWDQATALHLERRYDEAEKLYDQLLTQNPNNSGLCATIGTLFLQTRRPGLAIHFLEAARNGTLGKQADVLSNLALAYKHAGMTEKAMDFFDASIKGDEVTAETLANYSGVLIESGQDERCQEMCAQAIKENPGLSLAHWNLSLSLLASGEWDRAWDEHEWGLKTHGMRADRLVADIPVWDGTPGKTVHVYGEQGMGDEIMFASMLPDILKTNSVVLECHTRLKTLFEKSFPGVPCYGTREQQMRPEWAENHKMDARLSIGSLGKFYRRSREAFPGIPYLSAEALPKGDRLRVGISWTGGGAKAGRVQKRSVPLSWWKPILEQNDVEFISLQYTDAAEELDIAQALGREIRVMDEYVKAEDYYETARLVKSCDLVISCCTSVIHLAGALGVPCWVMTPRHPAWRYQNSGGMPWYRSVRLYRQPESKPETWKAVIHHVAHDLAGFISERKALKLVA